MFQSNSQYPGSSSLGPLILGGKRNRTPLTGKTGGMIVMLEESKELTSLAFRAFVIIVQQNTLSTKIVSVSAM